MKTVHILREATQDLHHQTEAMMPADALLKGTLRLAEYRRLMAAQYLIFQSLEQHLQEQLPAHSPLANFFRPRTPLLLADLSSINCAIPDDVTVRHHGATSQAALTGMLYVMEGSALGGQFILRGLKRNAALAHLPHHFYTGDGALTGLRWKNFCELCEITVPQGFVQEAVEAANETFGFFASMMQRHYRADALTT